MRGLMMQFMLKNKHSRKQRPRLAFAGEPAAQQETDLGGGHEGSWLWGGDFLV